MEIKSVFFPKIKTNFFQSLKNLVKNTPKKTIKKANNCFFNPEKCIDISKLKQQAKCQ